MHDHRRSGKPSMRALPKARAPASAKLVATRGDRVIMCRTPSVRVGQNFLQGSRIKIKPP